jgi:DNA polymerase-3 subunit beta
MKVIVNRTQLLRLLDRCADATKDGSLTHGRSVLLSAEQQPDQLRMSAISVNLAVDTCHLGKVDRAGDLLVNAPRLQSLVQAMPDGTDVTLAFSGERLQVTAANRRYSIATLQRDLFPPIPDSPENKIPLLIPTDALGNAMEYTEFAVDNSPTHEHLFGVQLRLSRGLLEGTAFNGHCAVRTSTKCDVVGQGELFVPHPMQRTLKALCNENKSLRCDKDERRLYVETDETLLSVLLPPTAFPNSEHVFGMFCDPVCAVDGDLLARALKAMLTVAPKADITLELAPPVLKLSLTDVDDGCSGDEQLDAQVSSADAHFRVMLNGSYLASAVRACNIVELGIQDPTKDPLWVRSQDRTFVAAIMPIVHK